MNGFLSVYGEMIMCIMCTMVANKDDDDIKNLHIGESDVTSVSESPSCEQNDGELWPHVELSIILVTLGLSYGYTHDCNMSIHGRSQIWA